MPWIGFCIAHHFIVVPLWQFPKLFLFVGLAFLFIPGPGFARRLMPESELVGKRGMLKDLVINFDSIPNQYFVLSCLGNGGLGDYARDQSKLVEGCWAGEELIVYFEIHDEESKTGEGELIFREESVNAMSLNWLADPTQTSIAKAA
eukprot:GHVT01015212.1.p1 GENE.GHVT01015212.1~~GHVT01015212.1.p1  ORF type:complete len:147 (+),score=2.54 GHVT01015212.1:188-628(+)